MPLPPVVACPGYTVAKMASSGVGLPANLRRRAPGGQLSGGRGGATGWRGGRQTYAQGRHPEGPLQNMTTPPLAAAHTPLPAGLTAAAQRLPPLTSPSCSPSQSRGRMPRAPVSWLSGWSRWRQSPGTGRGRTRRRRCRQAGRQEDGWAVRCTRCGCGWGGMGGPRRSGRLLATRGKQAACVRMRQSQAA